MSDDKKADLQPILLGSSTLPAMIDVGAGQLVQLGTVVANAFEASGKTEEDWNTMPDADRDVLLEAEIGRMRAASGPTGSTDGPSEDQMDGLADELKAFLAEQVRQLGEETGRQIAALREEMAGEVEKSREYLDEQLGKIHEAFEGLDMEKLEGLAAQLKTGGVADLEARLATVEGRLRNFVH